MTNTVAKDIDPTKAKGGIQGYPPSSPVPGFGPLPSSPNNLASAQPALTDQVPGGGQTVQDARFGSVFRKFTEMTGANPDEMQTAEIMTYLQSPKGWTDDEIAELIKRGTQRYDLED